MKSTKTLILPGLLLAVLIIFYLYTLSGIEQNSGIYRTESYTPYGLKALHLFIKKYHYSFQPRSQFQKKFNACLVITGDNFLTKRVYHEITHWVQNGGILIELAVSKPHFSDTTSYHFKGPIRTLNSDKPQFKQLHYHLTQRIPFVASNQVHGIYGVEQKYFIYSEPLGKGMIISWNDPDGLVNRNLRTTPDHAVIFLRLLQQRIDPGPIAILDLRYVRHNSSSFLKEIFNRHAAAAFLIITGMLLSLWKLSSRFGRPRPLSLTKGRSRNEFVIFLAALFQQAGAREMVIDNLYRALRETILEITKQPPKTPADPAIRYLEMLSGKDYRPLYQIMESIETRRIYQTLSRTSFLPLVSKLDGYRKELENWKKSRSSAMM